MKIMKKHFKIFYHNNAGENKTKEENCAKHFEEIDIEFTSPETMQQNKKR